MVELLVKLDVVLLGGDAAAEQFQPRLLGGRLGGDDAAVDHLQLLHGFGELGFRDIRGAELQVESVLAAGRLDRGGARHPFLPVAGSLNPAYAEHRRFQ